MDWELKALASDFTAVVGSSSLGVIKNGDFSVDLKLGGLGDLGDMSMKRLKESRGSAISSSSKRTRVMSGTQNVSCFVDGCTAHLSDCREYYRRHRVCERHSKTPVVVVGGKELRFCQQCSRFHSLGEFDGEKRSCRKRLDGHNRRRRKPQPDAFYLSSGSYLSSHQGARLLCFGVPQTYPSSTAGFVPSWPRVTTHDRDLPATDQQSTLPNSLACIYNGGHKQFPFLLANDPQDPIYQQPVNNSASPEMATTLMGHKKTLSDRLTQSVNSKCALSLLSSHPTETLEASLCHLLQGDVIHTTGVHYDGLVQRPVLVPQASNPWNQILQGAPDDLLEKGASHVLPFSWN